MHSFSSITSLAITFVAIFTAGLFQQCSAVEVMPYTVEQESLSEGVAIVGHNTPVQKPTSTPKALLIVLGMFAASILIGGLSYLITMPALGVFAPILIGGLRVLSFGLLIGSVVAAVRVASPRTTPVVVLAK